MISLKELNPCHYPTTPEIDDNLSKLLIAINVIRTAWGKPMIVTSGLRSAYQQGMLIAMGRSTATKSHHLTGEAVDILDEDGRLKDWVLDNMSLMETTGFWFEDFEHTKGWVHFQCVPPKSGRRIFIP